MTTGLATTLTFFRGQSVRWKTTFFDFDGNIVQPGSANLIVFASTITQDDVQTTIAMTPPVGGATAWTAVLDTRNFVPRKIQWSIEAAVGNQPAPVAAEDGFFMLTANQANQPTF